MLRFLLIILIAVLFDPFLHAQKTDLYPPETIKLTFDISNNHLHIFWKPSSSSNLDRYEIWYPNDSASLGSIPSTPVPGSRIEITKFDEDFEFSEALWYSMGFYVRTFDKNGNESPVWSAVPCDSTVFLKAAFDSCSSSVSLRWNDYHRWRGKIAGYKIYGSTDGIAYQLFGSVSEGTNDMFISNIDANQLYRFYVLAVNNNTGDSTFSNRVDIDTKMSENPSYIYADYGTVSEDHPYLKFSVDPASQLSRYVLVRAISPDSEYDSVALIQSAVDVIEFTDKSVSSSQQAYYYKLNALNYCNGVVRSSPIAGTIYLAAVASGTTINLAWNEYVNWINGVDHYIIERKVNDQNYEVLTTTHNLSYTDNSFENQSNQIVGSEICYKITAVENHSSFAVTSISNEACVNLEMNVRFEFDAFIPGSANNNTFGPSMDFIPESIKFCIFNRWGNLVFEGNDPYNLRWDGYYKGKPVDQGVFRYKLEYKNEHGKTVVIQGNVTVVYP
jgi:gliding motility-associated-like protein